jgi:hypothetical protein
MSGRRWFPWLLCAGLCSSPNIALADDAASIVARARDQIDSGNYSAAASTLGLLRGKTLPPQLAVDAALLETTAALVNQGQDQAIAACGRAVVAAGFDPEVARDLSPKVREACKTAAKKVRGDRLASEKIEMGKLSVQALSVAYEPVRISTTVDKKVPWLRVVARVEASGIEGAFDVPLIPSDEGPLLGTLDASWIRPKATLTIRLVAQDRFGDLSTAVDTQKLQVPAAEAAIALGTIPKGAVIKLDGNKVAADAKGIVAASAGKHEISMTLDSGASAEADVELTRGKVAQVGLVPQETSPSRALPWVATGTSLALLAAGGVLLINAEARRSELQEKAAEREPGTGLPANDYATLKSVDDERTLFQNVGIGLLAGGGGVAIAATIFWLVPIGGSSSSARVTPVIAPGYAGARLTF